jgi:aryl-alcohol dehydrogenase (NADP+)
VAPGSVGHSRYVKPASHEIVKRLLDLASKKGVKPSQLAIAWLIYKGVTAPIIGTSNVGHLEELVESIDVNFTSKDAEYLEEPYTPQSTDSWR